MNISNRHASKKDFVNKLCEILNENMIDQGNIKLELTDTLEVEKIEDYKVMFEKLKECGTDIIINNVELKYDNIKLFSDLPIDEMKIDARFVANDSTLNYDLLKNIIDISKNLNYKVIINCIENEKELNYAIRNGANSIQGDFLFKKMNTKLAEEFVKEYDTYVNKLDGIIIKANSLKNINK
jgi:EAL domain-containing protein (putative c-di-GMP-specific phosphodiesterase class I)